MDKGVEDKHEKEKEKKKETDVLKDVMFEVLE